MKKLKDFIKMHKTILISILITIIIELFICNFTYFRTLFVGNNNLSAKYTYIDNVITIQDIDTRITGININYKNKLTNQITYKLAYTAEENSIAINLREKTILNNGKHYIHFDTHSKCKEIKVELDTREQDLMIDNIILNHPNLNISIMRIIFIFVIVIFFINVKNKTIYQTLYDKDSKIQSLSFKLSLALFCLLIFVYTICQFYPKNFFIEKENINKDDTILMQTEAIINGQIHLTEKPSELLKLMDDPYDYSLREQLRIRYLYDVAYYKGRYYSYFGVAPILTSVLPFRIITGKYTYTYMFNFVYIFISIIALYSLYKKLIDKYVKKISLCNFYLGFYTIILASNILTLLRGLKYDIVVTSGIAFLLLSLNLAISLQNNSRYKKLKLILLGITSSLIVLSKPNLIIYYFLILFFINTSFKSYDFKDKIKNYSLILIPLGVFAIFQMVLNYIRFDNILEFGARYQLTGFNMNYCMSITFGKVYAGLMEYIFRTPTINPLKFPFVFKNVDMSAASMNEICYENGLLGLIGIPILYIYFIKGNILKKKSNVELKNFVNISLITSILSIIITTCCGGICEPYSIDFKLILAISAVILALNWVSQNKDNQDINKIFLLLCIATFAIMIPICLTTEYDLLNNEICRLTVILKNIFEFWT